jgi:hypothetical protein
MEKQMSEKITVTLTRAQLECVLTAVENGIDHAVAGSDHWHNLIDASDRMIAAWHHKDEIVKLFDDGINLQDEMSQIYSESENIKHTTESENTE